MAVVPEKADAGAEDRGAEDRQLARVAQVEDVQVRARIHATHHVRKHRERRGGNGA